jgi:hypothetical protein
MNLTSLKAMKVQEESNVRLPKISKGRIKFELLYVIEKSK